MSRVAITRCSSYKDVSGKLTENLNLLGGLDAFIVEGERVLLKVNTLRAATPDEAVTTHPEMVRAMIREVKAVGGVPVVGDSPGSGTFKQAAEKAGIMKVCREEEAKTLPLDEGMKRRNEHGRYQFFELSKRLEEVDRIINMPKLKTHLLTGFTGAVKNLYGCIPGKTKAYMHVTIQDPRDFSGMLIDLAGLVKPTLNVMDAVVGMQGKGPNAGEPRTVGLILAGEDALAVDWTATRIVGLGNVPLFKQAAQRDLAHAHGEGITIVGTSISECRLTDFKPADELRVPASLARVGKRLFSARPVVIADLCSGCGKCARICPKDAITMKKKRPVFDYTSCIRCFCCHELCPQKAIGLRSSLPIRVMAGFKSLFR